MNTNFGRVEDHKMTYAPNALTVEGGIMLNPSAEEYRKQNWLQNENTAPAPEEGYHVKSSAWETDGEKNYKTYEYEKDARVYRKFLRFDLIVGMKKLGIYDTVVELLKGITIADDMTAYDGFMSIDAIRESYEGFDEMYAQICEAVIAKHPKVTQKQLDNLLEYAKEA